MAEKITLSSIKLNGPIPESRIDSARNGDAKGNLLLFKMLAERLELGVLTDADRSLLVSMLKALSKGVPAGKAAMEKSVKLSKVGRPNGSEAKRLLRTNAYLDRAEELGEKTPAAAASVILEAVAKEYGVSRRTVIRDIEWISSEGSWLERAKRALGKN